LICPAQAVIAREYPSLTTKTLLIISAFAEFNDILTKVGLAFL
jgi:hypothetical protein